MSSVNLAGFREDSLGGRGQHADGGRGMSVSERMIEVASNAASCQCRVPISPARLKSLRIWR